MEISKPLDRRDTMKREPYRAPPSHFVPIVINGKLVFKFDPERGLIEWQHRGEKHLIDLADFLR